MKQFSTHRKSLPRPFLSRGSWESAAAGSFGCARDPVAQPRPGKRRASCGVGHRDTRDELHGLNRLQSTLDHGNCVVGRIGDERRVGRRVRSHANRPGAHGKGSRDGVCSPIHHRDHICAVVGDIEYLSVDLWPRRPVQAPWAVCRPRRRRVGRTGRARWRCRAGRRRCGAWS
jgi:hypothetical protein